MRRKILKKKYKNLCKLVLGGVAFFSSMFINQHNLNALPIADTHDKNNVTFSGSNVTGSVANGFMAWKDFSVDKGETLTFSGMTNMLNYVTLPNASLIYGTIDASAVTGNFYIVNPSGILFGKDSTIKAPNLFVSTRSMTDSEISSYISGGSWSGSGAIGNGGLKSSDIMGIYDIADGDVMFLGKVEADKITVEGNTIQIRNSNTFKSGSTATFNSSKAVEIGYEGDSFSKPSGWTGKFEGYKLISDPYDFAYIANGNNYMLNNDITGFNSPDLYSDSFKSDTDSIKINGLNFTISNANVTNGLFPYFGGTIKNLRLSGVYVHAGEGTAERFAGGLIGITNGNVNVTVKNVGILGGEVTYDAYSGSAGGLIGEINGGNNVILENIEN